MRQQDYFGNAIWVTGTSQKNQPFYVLRGKFTVTQVKKAQLNVVGLGFFYCYINGKRISQDEFLPLFTDFERRENRPTGEVLTGHRLYVPRFDVTELLQDGENTISIHFGGGWYAVNDERFGLPKAIWSLQAETENGPVVFGSSEKDKIKESYITDYNFASNAYTQRDYETQDLREYDPAVFVSEYDDSAWDNAIAAKPVETRYMTSDCPGDRLQETFAVHKIGEAGGLPLYDTEQNCAVIPFFKIQAPAGEMVTVSFYEALKEDGTPDETTHHHQKFHVISDGKGHITRPMFTWFAFRYFTISGEAEPVEIRMLGTNVKVSSAFRCDNEVLNWLYDTFLITQRNNMHTGIPSDCPHIERRGYTGDGQLACHAVMNVLDSQLFYKKWIGDISDCQDTLTGHVQYTAPYTHCGGGPGGWGCAIIEVPYQYYKHYGDTQFLKDMYGQMLRYFDYLEAHSEKSLVTSDKEGEWCLGDWCPPDAVVLPAPYVNNYFYIKCLYRMIEIAKLVEKEEDIPMFESRIAERKEAIMIAYFNKWDGNFLGNVQGANAFAVDIGLGDQRTYANMVERYNKLGYFDTGIFGTDILIRILFENGDGDVAANLLMSEEDFSFGGMRKRGATTLWETWPTAVGARSLNHPMFGAVTAYLFDYILGIGQKQGGSGYENIVIAPKIPADLNFAEGYRTLPCGKVSVRWEKTEDKVSFHVSLPEGVTAKFVYNGMEKELQGDCIFEF